MGTGTTGRVLRSRGRRILDAAGGAAAIAAMLVGSPLLRGRYNRWGATDEECRAPMPGDELVPDPVLTSTRAVTIGAPPDAVWPWLAQIGQGRGGLYSYDDLENLLGLDIHSADEILPLHQQPAPGDLIRLGKPGSPCFRVSSVDPGRSLVLISADNVTEQAVPTPVVDGTGATWQWVLNPIREGRATRLVARQLNAHPRGQRLLWRVVEPIGFVMERRMLLGIKERAERGSWRGDTGEASLRQPGESPTRERSPGTTGCPTLKPCSASPDRLPRHPPCTAHSLRHTDLRSEAPLARWPGRTAQAADTSARRASMASAVSACASSRVTSGVPSPACGP